MILFEKKKIPRSVTQSQYIHYIPLRHMNFEECMYPGVVFPPPFAQVSSRPQTAPASVSGVLNFRMLPEIKNLIFFTKFR